MLPRPAQFDRDLERIRARLRGLSERYAWAYYWGLAPPSGSASGPISGGSSDGVEAVITAAGKRRARAACERAAGQVVAALNALEQARRELRRALQEVGPPPPTPRGPFPQVVTPQELEESRAAQRRRREAGQWYGEG